MNRRDLFRALPAIPFIAVSLAGACSRRRDDYSRLGSHKIGDSKYFTDPNAWYIKTDHPEGLKYYQRRSVSHGLDGPPDYAISTERWGEGFTDMRGIFGAPGL